MSGRFQIWYIHRPSPVPPIYLTGAVPMTLAGVTVTLDRTINYARGKVQQTALSFIEERCSPRCEQVDAATLWGT